MGALKKVLLIVITIFIPPLGAFLVAGCGMDLFINIILTLLGYLPGHVHAFYLEYEYSRRRADAKRGIVPAGRAPGIYSDKIQNPRVRASPEQPVAAGGNVGGQGLAGPPVYAQQPAQGYGGV